MPSHSAWSLVGPPWFDLRLDSAYYALGFIIAMVVIDDATGIRRQAGNTLIINQFITDLTAAPAQTGKLLEVSGIHPWSGRNSARPVLSPDSVDVLLEITCFAPCARPYHLRRQPEERLPALAQRDVTATKYLSPIAGAAVATCLLFGSLLGLVFPGSFKTGQYRSQPVP
jgi:hypothetical protein